MSKLCLRLCRTKNLRICWRLKIAAAASREDSHCSSLFPALEDELDFALGKQTAAFLRKCVCYIRKISNFDRFAKLPEMARYMDIVVSTDRVMRNQEAYERLLKVRDEFIPTVVAASNLRVYSSVTHCDMKLGYSQEVESNYVEGLCKQFYEDMVDIIQATVQQNFDTEADPLYDEILQHLSLCKSHAALHQSKAEPLDYIQEYLLPSKGSRMAPLVVYGGPCTGKTVLLAEAARQVRRHVGCYCVCLMRLSHVKLQNYSI